MYIKGGWTAHRHRWN